MNFELWIDESGDFNNDMLSVSQGKNPSLIGGLLVKTGSFPETVIEKIIPDAYHSVKETSESVFGKFTSICDTLFVNGENRIVIFENTEKILVLDNNLTYQNILVEGIVKLLKSLKVKYQDNVHLRMIIANRVDTTTGRPKYDSVVPSSVLEKKLREKLTMAGYENQFDENFWSLETRSAKKFKKNMVADNICNCFFTRDRKYRDGSYKFSEEARNYFNSVFSDENKTLIFTVLEDSTEKRFNEYLMEERFADAVSVACLSDKKRVKNTCFKKLNSTLEGIGSYDPDLQYKQIKATIEFIVNIKRDFKSALLFVNNLQKYYVGMLNNSGNEDAIDAAQRINCDLEFYKIAIYTHLGDIERSLQTAEKCDKAIAKLPANLINIDYRIKYALRKIAIFEANFEYEKALEENAELINQCNEVNKIIGLYYGHTHTHFVELAKAYSQRMRIKILMLSQDESLYKGAVKDGIKALDHFETAHDKKRVYRSLAMLESKMGHMDEALEYLKRSAGLHFDAEIQDLWDKIAKKSVFYCNAYAQVMADGIEHNHPSAKLMADCMIHSERIAAMVKEDLNAYPEEVIFRNIGRYYENTGNLPEAKKYYTHAYEICAAERFYSRNITGFSILLEYYACELKENTENTKRILTVAKNTYCKLAVRYPEEMNRIFGKIDWNQTADYYFAVSRKVSY